MTPPLTNKQLAVLVVLRRHPDGIDPKRIAKEVTGPMLPCPDCGGTGEPSEAEERDHAEWLERLRERDEESADYYERTGTTCRRCHGRGERRQPYMDYSNAYTVAQRLVTLGHATRRRKLDEWGDVTGGVVYMPAEHESDDPLEQAFNAPAAEVPK